METLSRSHNFSHTHRLDEFTNLYAAQSWKEFYNSLFHPEQPSEPVNRYQISRIRKSNVSNLNITELTDSSQNSDESSNQDSISHKKIKPFFSFTKYMQYVNNSLKDEYKKYVVINNPRLSVIPKVRFAIKIIGYFFVALTHKALFFLSTVGAFFTGIFGKSDRDFVKEQIRKEPNGFSHKFSLCLVWFMYIITFIPFKPIGWVFQLLTIVIATPLLLLTQIPFNNKELTEVEAINDSIDILEKTFANHKKSYKPSLHELQILQDLINLMSCSNGRLTTTGKIVCQDYETFKNRFLEVQPTNSEEDESIPGNDDKLSKEKFAQLSQLLVRYSEYIISLDNHTSTAGQYVVAEFDNAQVEKDLARIPETAIYYENNRFVIPRSTESFKLRLKDSNNLSPYDLKKIIINDPHFSKVMKQKIGIDYLTKVLIFLVAQSAQAQTFELMELKDKKHRKDLSSGEAPRRQRIMKFVLENTAQIKHILTPEQLQFEVNINGSIATIKKIDFSYGFPYTTSCSIDLSKVEFNTHDVKFKINQLQTKYTLTTFALISDTVMSRPLKKVYCDPYNEDEKIDVWTALMGGTEAFVSTAMQSFIAID